MSDSHSREPGFESPLLPFRSLGIFVLFIYLYEYLAVDGDENMSEKSSHVIAT